MPSPITPIGPGGEERGRPERPKDPFPSQFAEMLRDALSQVDQKQKAAAEKIKQFATGEVQDLHEVMLAVQEAGLSLQLTLQVRNKIVEAYQEISRMQI